MRSHLTCAARAMLERSPRERIASIRQRRWINHPVAQDAARSLEDLLERPSSLRMQGRMLVGPYCNGKTMIVERFAMQDAAQSGQRRVWIVQTREGAGLGHFYASILDGLGAPERRVGVARLGEQVDRILTGLRPRLLIFDEFHNALRGRARDIEAIFAFLRRIGRLYDISPVLVGEPQIFDYVTATEEMSTRIKLLAVPRWRYDEDYLSLLDSFEMVLPLAQPSELSDEPIARRVLEISEGLIGEIVEIVTLAAAEAVAAGEERISLGAIDALPYVPVSQRSSAAVRETLL